MWNILTFISMKFLSGLEGEGDGEGRQDNIFSFTGSENYRIVGWVGRDL